MATYATGAQTPWRSQSTSRFAASQSSSGRKKTAGPLNASASPKAAKAPAGRRFSRK